MEPITYEHLQAPYGIKAGSTCQIVLKKTRVDIEIDPNESETADDTFTLFSTDVPSSYTAKKTVKDDKVPGDAMISLAFYSLPESLNYSMEVDPGKEGEKYLLFENVPFEHLGCK
jgi:hypothetical protein